MEQEFYFPPERVQDISAWYKNFHTKLAPIAATFDITAAELAQVNDFNKALEYVAGRQAAYEGAVKLFINTRVVLWKGDPERPNLEQVNYPAQVALVDPVPAEVPPNIYARTRSLALRLREHPNMTTSIAMSLGILPKEKPSDGPNGDYTPYLRGEVLNGQVVLDCPIRDFSGYEVYCDDEGGLDFKWKTNAVGRFWTDTTPLPEGLNSQLRNYRVRMLDSNSKPVGQFSNIGSLTAYRVI